MNKKSLLIACLVVAGAMFAQADQVSYSGAAGAPLVNGAASVSVNVQQFNNVSGPYAGAILTGVTLSIVSGTQSADLSLYNSGTAQSFPIRLDDGLISFNDGLGGHATSTALSYNDSVSVAGDTLALGSATTPSGSAFQSYGSLASYIGSGFVSNMTVDFAGSWGARLLGVGDIFTVVTHTGAANWMVTYDFTPVPEPASTSLLLLGAAAIGLRRRFKKTV